MIFDDLIIGEKFVQVAELVFSGHILDGMKDYNELTNTFDIAKLKDVNVVYLHTMFKDEFFDIIYNLPQKFVVVTHNSDANVTSIDNVPDNIIRWFSQNVAVHDNRLESLPIGLENSRWFPEINKKRKMLEKINTQKSIKNTVYINHNIGTNKTERWPIYKLLSDRKYVTSKTGSNPYNFDQYLDDIYNHRFVVSPIGNGIDTHRKWEALYLGTIPIEKRSINNSFYSDLPICFVDDWEQLTEEFLDAEYIRIARSSWNLEKLKMSYWLNKIKSV
jgi:hypothetical protein